MDRGSSQTSWGYKVRFWVRKSLTEMRDLQDELGITYLFISHNSAIVRRMAHRVGVIYFGRLVEIAPRAELSLHGTPRHPYTRMLLDAVPDLAMTGRRRPPVEGEIPNPIDPPGGCRFHPRCPYVKERCRLVRPQPRAVETGWVACHAVEEARI
jgi:peptide/nickel transport system ATP-binding protein